ncbi:MAG TPA: hypothetical protein ENJ05_02955 [Thiotrichales bacterium]|nr:hypothetical protein [Thiotrichales bacterium]
MPRQIRGRIAARWFPLVLLLAAAVSPLSLAAAVTAVLDEGTYTRVDGETISMDEYRAAVTAYSRRTFYHGRIPEAEAEAAARRAGAELIIQRLLLKEAARQQVAADEDWVAERLAAYDRRYGNNPSWRKNRERLLPQLRRSLEDESRIQRLKSRVTEVTTPDEDVLLAYYRANPEKFTEPARSRLSVILLRVPPSAAPEAWDAAKEEAARLVRQLRAGADFAELARLHSADPSAEQGGDMGYLHRGMLAEPAQKAVDALSPGEISDPVVLLQGVAIFRLEDVTQPKLRDFEEVKERAANLWKRERTEQAWQGLLQKLWDEATIEVAQGHPLPTLQDVWSIGGAPDPH